MEEHFINPNKKEYIWTEDMDYELFCRANSLSKDYDENYKTFLFLEQQYITALSDILCQDSIATTKDVN